MLSFLQFLDHYDFDLFLKENNVLYSTKKLILSFSFLNFIFQKKKGNDLISNKRLRTKMIRLLKQENIYFEEYEFKEIYLLNEELNLDKIFQDCDGKSERRIKNLTWFVINKEDFKLLIRNPTILRKNSNLKILTDLSLDEVLVYYSDYLSKNIEEKLAHVSVL